MESQAKPRRSFLQSSMLAVAGMALVPAATSAQTLTGGSLTADLMHDHGLVRHALAIYQHAAARLQQERLDTREQAVLSKALNETARIFRDHAENYHAKAIEETHMFPMLMKMQQASAEIEQRMLGQNAYDAAFNRLVAIENNLGIADLGQYTMPDIRSY